MRSFAHWVSENPWKLVLFSALITVVLAFFIPGIETVTNFEEYLSADNPAVRARREAEKRYGSRSLLNVTVEAPESIFDLQVLERIESLGKEISKVEGVNAVQGPLNSQVITGKEQRVVVEQLGPGGEAPRSEAQLTIFRERLMAQDLLVGRVVSPDGSAGALSIELKTGVNEQKVADDIRGIVDNYQGPEEINISGLPFMNSVLAEEILQDLSLLLPLVFVGISAVLFASFRSLRGVLLPLLVVILSTTWTIGLMALLGIPFTLISFIIPVILVAVGTAYSIHVLNKYNELANKGLSRKETIVETCLAMYSPVSMAGLTTAAGFLALISSFLIPQRQFGIFAAIGVFLSVVFSLTLVPAVLSFLEIPAAKPSGSGQNSRPSFFNRVFRRLLGSWQRVVIGRKKTLLVGFLVVVLIFAVGAAMVEIETSQQAFLGEDNPVTKGMNSLDKNFSGSQQLVVEIDTGRREGLMDPETLGKMENFQDWLEQKDGVSVNTSYSLVDNIKQLNKVFQGGDQEYYRVPGEGDLISQLLLMFEFQGGGLGPLATGDYSAGQITALYDSQPSSDIIEFRDEVQVYLEENFPEFRAEMVGDTRLSAMVASRVVSSQLVSLLASITIAGLIVAAITTSLTAGLVSLIPLVLTVLINFGVMGYSRTPLDLATLMVSSIVIGIGIDYAIHFIERFRREYDSSREELEIYSTTLRTTGRGIFYNASALTVGFGVLLFSSFTAVANFGFLMALTMIVSMVAAFSVIPAILLVFKPKFLSKGKQ